MSRLDSFIRRLEAQRVCIDFAASLIGEVPGVVLELGLGNGRTYDHLRSNLPWRRVIVFERDPRPHPDCWPADEDLIVGDLDTTLPGAAARWPAGAALIHSDIGTGDAEFDRGVALRLARALPPLLAPGGVVLSDQQLVDDSLERLSCPAGIDQGRYFIYRRR